MIDWLRRLLAKRAPEGLEPDIPLDIENDLPGIKTHAESMLGVKASWQRTHATLFMTFEMPGAHKILLVLTVRGVRHPVLHVSAIANTLRNTPMQIKHVCQRDGIQTYNELNSALIAARRSLEEFRIPCITTG